jgi:nucleotide-binding universal stress UspA family protein
MAIKRILAWLATHPRVASERLMATAVAIARTHGAQLNASVTTPQLPRSSHWILSGMMSGMAHEVEQRAKAAALELSQRFDTARQEAGLVGSASQLQFASSDLDSALAPLARLHDLTIAELGQDEEAKTEVETLIFAAGRPVLVLPAADDDATQAIQLHRFAIAWDGSRTATRAVHDAMPMLKTASAVDIITISDDKDLKHVMDAASLGELLACHGIATAVRAIKGHGKPTALVLQHAVEDVRADALVMGAYGHSRTREFVLGGATMGMLSAPKFPLLFSH